MKLSYIIWLVAALGSLVVSDARGTGITALYTFTGSTDGGTPSDGLMQASNGVCYGTTVNGGGMNGFGTIYKFNTNGTFTPLYTLTYKTTNGAYPYAGLVMLNNGILYGLADAGGSNNYGSFFKITTNGAFTELFAFDAEKSLGLTLTNKYGANPTSTLVQGTNGNLYGSAPGAGSKGFGTLFEVTTNGVFTVLHSFTNGADGAYPGALYQSANGLLYGTTTNGGTGGYGAIFKMTAAGGLTPLYSFTNGVDGALPGAALTQGTSGILYGTASAGGTNGSGVIFQITTNGVFTPLYSFAPSGMDELGSTTNADGLDPGPLLPTAGGILCGFTQAGGLNGTGSLFQFAPGAGLTTFYTFLTGQEQPGGLITNPLGANPTGIMIGQDGNLYGTAKNGGSIGYGTIFVTAPPPLIVSAPTNCEVALGGTATFKVVSPGSTCQWDFNGIAIPDATNFSLTNLNVEITNAGPYQAVLSDNGGSITSAPVYLEITNVPVAIVTTAGALQYAGGQFGLTLTNLTGQGTVIISRSTDLAVWDPVYTNPPSFGDFEFIDAGAAGLPVAFYRAQFIPGQ